MIRCVVVAVLGLGLQVPLPTHLHGQTDDHAAVRAVVDELFGTFISKDSALARSLFMDEAVLGRATADGIQHNELDGFIRFLGTPSDQKFREPIWDVVIQVDGQLATVWAQYALFRGPNGDILNHCGVDAFSLYRTEGGWKIFSLIDTARNEGCDVPRELR